MEEIERGQPVVTPEVAEDWREYERRKAALRATAPSGPSYETGLKEIINDLQL